MESVNSLRLYASTASSASRGWPFWNLLTPRTLKPITRPEKIIGVWELQIWETVVDDKVIGYPLGEKASGFIAYHPIGFMSVNLSAPNRVRLPTDDPFAGDPKLLALDAEGYLSYCGPFSIVSENEVIHHLKLCSFKNWVGTDQHRHAQFDVNKDTLTLSTAPTLTQGRMGSNRLTWKRIASTQRKHESFVTHLS